MYKADLKHPSSTLQQKLEALYGLNRGAALKLSFRPSYLNLLERFGNPHDHLPPTIHVAGTNGKGSTIAMMRAMLEAGGYKVHVYTSPHLHRFNERIVLAGQEIDDKALEELIDEVIALNGGADITFFEITTAMAFAAFKRTPADVLLLEVGLGGRMDCTNIIAKPYVSIINRISMDHTEFLGNTLSEIAQEKAGIIKYETPCVVGYQGGDSGKNTQNSPMDRIVEQAGDKNAPLYRAGNEWSCEENADQMIFTFKEEEMHLSRPNLVGAHQVRNAGTALAALKILQDTCPLKEDHIEQGLKNIVWPARLERIEKSQNLPSLPANWELWYDGGHNDSAGAALAEQIKRWDRECSMPTHLIVGMKDDKDPKAYLKDILPMLSTVSVTRVNDIGACVTAAKIEPLTKDHALQFLGEHANPADALKNIMNRYRGASARVIICGSLYLAEKL